MVFYRNVLRTFVQENTPFLFPCLVFCAGSAIALLIWDCVVIQMALNAVHTPFLDVVWKLVSVSGSGVFFLCAWLAGGLFSRRYLLCGALSIVLTVSVTLAIKYWADAPRPVLVLTEAGLNDVVPWVEGHPLRTTPSFPSGHTATAFCLFALSAFFLRPFGLKVAMFCIGLAVGYSRIYLMQHFLQDVAFGAFIGTASAAGVFVWMESARGRNPARPANGAGRCVRTKKRDD